MRTTALLLLLALLAACQNNTPNRLAHAQGHFEALCEMVNAEAKPLGVSYPMEAWDIEEFYQEAQKIAQQYGVEMVREGDFPVLDLFDEALVDGKEVVLVYQGNTYLAYQALKEEVHSLIGNPADMDQARADFSRRLGRLLGYSPQKINTLLAQTTEYRALTDFGVKGQAVTLYYEDLPGAVAFYEETLGLTRLLEEEHTVVFRVAEGAFLKLADVAHSHHSPAEAKSVAVAFLTAQLAKWWDYLVAAEVPIKYTYKPREGGPHDGFVAIDPEGYLLEFEEFKQHPENEKFVPQLAQNPTVLPQHASSQVPEGLGFHSMITWLYYQDVLGMQGFYEETLGFALVADQGWTKIYQVAPTAFIGLVDERRGMNDYADEKAVELAFLLEQPDAFWAYLQNHEPFEVLTHPEEATLYLTRDPERYLMDFLSDGWMD
ncbi:MAG: VOC family protein [Bacteroidota bacterium]